MSIYGVRSFHAALFYTRKNINDKNLKLEPFCGELIEANSTLIFEIELLGIKTKVAQQLKSEKIEEEKARKAN